MQNSCTCLYALPLLPNIGGVIIIIIIIKNNNKKRSPRCPYQGTSFHKQFLAKPKPLEWNGSKSQSSIVIVFQQSPHLWKNVDILYLKIKAMNNVVHDMFSGIWRNSVEKQF